MKIKQPYNAINITWGLLVLMLHLELASGACLLNDYSVPSEYQRSTAVVIAQPVSERTIMDREEPDLIAGTIYTISVKEFFRGSLSGKVDIYSENSSGRFPLITGKTYLLFLYSQQGYLSADYCGNSGLIGEKTNVITE